MRYEAKTSEFYIHTLKIQFCCKKVYSQPYWDWITQLIKIDRWLLQEESECNLYKGGKGNITVAMERDSYFEKIRDLLHDPNTYSIIKKNPIRRIEKTLNDTLKRWYEHEYINKFDYLRLKSSDSILPRAYGLPKIHKEPLSFRIIVIFY